MKISTTYSVLLAMAFFVITGPAFGDEIAPKQPLSDAATTTATATATAPSSETLKQARIAGYKPQTRDGNTLFCKEEAALGSHLTKKQCINESGLKAMLADQQRQRDQMRKPNACAGAGGNCMGK